TAEVGCRGFRRRCRFLSNAGLAPLWRTLRDGGPGSDGDRTCESRPSWVASAVSSLCRRPVPAVRSPPRTDGALFSAADRPSTVRGTGRARIRTFLCREQSADLEVAHQPYRPDNLCRALQEHPAAAVIGWPRTRRAFASDRNRLQRRRPAN